MMDKVKNKELIQQFYEAFAKGDAESMIGCYHDQVLFSDPAFGELKGDHAKNMWRMLIGNSKGNTKITYSNIWTDEKTGTASWVAEYIFSKTGNKVINRITATFEFEEGKIVRHSDVFDVWKWSRQAFGFTGLLLGWSGMFRQKLQKQTGQLLYKFENRTDLSA